MTSAEWTPSLGAGAGRLDGGQAVQQHGAEDLDHLAVAITGGAQLPAHPLDRGRQLPVLEWRAIPEGARLAGEHRNVMPGGVDGLAPAEGSAVAPTTRPSWRSWMIEIGADLDRPADGLAHPECGREIVERAAWHGTGVGSGGSSAGSNGSIPHIPRAPYTTVHGS